MIETERLLLRRWEDRDRAVFHAHCSDPRVMEFLGPPMSRAEVDVALLGFCGLKPGATGTPLDGEVEIGWRLGHAHWGQGHAREAAGASLAWGWAHLDAPRVGAITTVRNVRSRGLMERLGMTRSIAGDFDYPAVAPDSALRPHVTYFVARPPHAAAVHRGESIEP